MIRDFLPRGLAAGLVAAAFLVGLVPASLAAAPNLSFSGSAQSSLSAALGTGSTGSYGFEEYANLRLKAKAGERGTVYAALNLLAASGSAAAALTAGGTPHLDAEGYAASLELERLYLRVDGELADLDLGLMRFPFGFGQAFSPSDFLSKRNPLVTDARPRGRLGVLATAYPSDFSRLLAFGLSGSEAANTEAEGLIAGLAGELHGESASVQALYAFEAPGAASNQGVHRAGLSLKLEAGAGIVLDALYTLDPAAAEAGTWYGADWAWHRGLEASLGFDYSLLKGDLYLLGQYLFRGPGPLTALGGNGLHQYLYTAATYRIDDYSGATLSCLASLDDLSFSPAFIVEHEPFQGLSLSTELRVPLDRKSFGGDTAGELGPDRSGFRAALRMSAKLKF